MISAVNFNAEKLKAKGDLAFSARPISDREERFLRLGALLHDIGHVAAGHTLEDELALIGKHDEDKRLTLVFEKSKLVCFDVNRQNVDSQETKQ